MHVLPWLALLAISTPDLVRDRTPLESFRENLRHGADFLPGELLITGESVDHQSFLEKAGARLGCKLERRFGNRPLFLFECPRAARMERLFADWEKVEGVRWIEASYVEEEEATPNDVDIGQWYHHNTGQRIDGVDGVIGADIGSIDAWDITTGSQDMVILIADVGLYPQHVDLADQIWVNDDEDCTNGVDDDGNGYVDDCRGYDFGDEDNDPTPITLPEYKSSGSTCPKWHASMIAGLAGARGNNDQGVAGINWNVSFMNVKKHRDSSCVSTTSRTIEAVTYAIDNGANVISMSFNSSTYNATFEAALQEAERHNLVIVSSGGNSAEDDDQERRYPNQYDVDASLVLVNSTNQDTLYIGSNWGANTVDMAAPGTNVLTTAINSPTALAYGTGSSFSAAFGAGAATLVWSAFPALTNLEVTQAIEEGVQPLDAMDCAVTARCVRTGGRIDLFGALQRASEIAPPSLFTEAHLPERLERGMEADLGLSLMNMGRGTAYGVDVRIADPGGLEGIAWETEVGNVPSGQTVDVSGLRVRAPLNCESYDATLRLAFSDRFGKTWEEDVTAHVECTPQMMMKDPTKDPEMNQEVEGGEERSGGGCSAVPAADGGLLLVLVLGAGALIRRRR